MINKYFVVVITFALAACSDGEVLRIAPKIQVDACAEPEYVTDCALDYGEVPISFTRPLDIKIFNPSPIELRITKIELSADSDPAFSVVEPAPSTVSPSDEPDNPKSSVLQVSFAPQVESAVQATLLIYSDAANMGSDAPIEVLLTGSGKDLGAPELRVEPAECDFGDVGVNATAFCDLSVTNGGQLDLVIDQVHGDGDFDAADASAVFRPASVLPVPVYLPSQAGATVRIACTPSAATAFSGNLYFESNDPNAPTTTVPLRCTGAEVPTAVARVAEINNQAVSGEVPQVSPLDDVVLTGADSTPGTQGRTITGYQWSIVSKPAESTVQLRTPDQVETGFSFNSSGVDRPGLDVVGTFVVRLVVTDSQGLQSTNDARVALNAVPGEDVHIQISWDHASADIDLHLNRNGGSYFTAEDCYFSNCKGASGLNWGGGGANPHLDVDDTDGFGPENINMSGPNDGVYRVGVHYWTPHSGSVPALINVKIFMRGALRAEYNRQLTTCNQFWEVADVEWPSGLVTPVDSMRMESRGSCR